MKWNFILISCCLIAACAAFYPEEKTQDAKLLEKIVTTTAQHHLEPRLLNDSLSKEIFDYYLTQIDPEKSLLTRRDLQGLSKYQYALDEEFREAKFIFFEKTQKLLKHAIFRAASICEDILQQELNLLEKDNLEKDVAKLDFAKDELNLKKHWTRKIKETILETLFVQENKASTADVLENQKAVIAQVKGIYALRFKRLKAITEQQRRDQYLNAFLKVHDVQTEFLSKERKANWDANFTRSFVGLGIQIEIVEGYLKIKSLTIGGPAWSSKTLEQGDVILAIGEEGQRAVDVFGKSLQEVLALLKGNGEAGTKVDLRIRKLTGETASQTITRDKINFDLAMSFILSEKDKANKIGYIRLPRFYAGEEGSAYHIWKEITALKKNDIQGLIFDVRNNQGGSSREAIAIISYFLDEGTIMQVKDSQGRHRSYEDEDGNAIYDGKLIVLTNSRSSSASELFAGNLQDYKRALIVGSKSTYGKGSMQRFYDMEIEQDGKLTSLGNVKMTIGRFYTGSGRSPQYDGIKSDIILPDDDAYLPSGERIHDHVLARENLPLQACTQTVNIISKVENIQRLSKKRVGESQAFQLAEQKAHQLKLKQENSLQSLHYKDFFTQKKKEQATLENYKAIFQEIPNFQVNLLAEERDLADTSILRQRKSPWQIQLQKDPYVYECLQIMNDLLG